MIMCFGSEQAEDDQFVPEISMWQRNEIGHPCVSSMAAPEGRRGVSNRSSMGYGS